MTKSYRPCFLSLIKAGLLLAAIISSPSVTHAAEAYVGVSLGWVSLDEKKGEINPTQSDVELSLSLAAKSQDRYFGDTPFGYYYEVGLDRYKAEEENIVQAMSGPEDWSTAISGEYWHFTPTLFIDFNRGSASGGSFKIGAGIGLSYFSVKGTMVFNNPTVRIEEVDDSDFSQLELPLFTFGVKTDF